MDLMYLSENFAFNSYRAPVYDKYRQPCTSEESGKQKTAQQKVVEKNSPIKTGKGGIQHCKLCKEKSKKPLATYIRQKSTCDAINCIEEEEGEE